MQFVREPIREADFLDIQVLLAELELLSQADVLCVALDQRAPKQLAETRNHELRARGITTDEPTNSAQRVVEEVRVDAHAQRLQSRALVLQRQCFASLLFIAIAK